MHIYERVSTVIVWFKTPDLRVVEIFSQTGPENLNCNQENPGTTEALSTVK